MKEFSASLLALATALGEPIQPERIIGYCAILNEFTEDQLVGACAVFAKSSRFFPKPCEFVDLIKTGQLPGDVSQDEAAAAWGKIMQTGSNVSGIRSLEREDYRIASGVAACGDAYSLIHGDEELKWKRRLFIQGFCGAVSEERRIALGITDLRRLPPPDVLMIDDGEDDEDAPCD